jgi:uncharacterized protein YbjT (DUF2867 family)
MYLVAGATGNVGAELVRALAGDGEPVRALTRTAGRDWPAGTEEVVGDLNDPASLSGALEGIRGAFLLSGYADMPGLLARIAGAGAKHVVLLSSSSLTGSDLDNAVAEYHGDSERVVRESGLDWTFLRPNSFMSNTLQWAPQLAAGDVVRERFADVALSVVDPYDVAAVAAVALTSDGHAGKAYRLSGPEALRAADRVRILGDALGRQLELRALGNDEARADMAESGIPEKYIRAFFSFFVDGTVDETTVHPDVAAVLGRPPRSFADWCTEHAAAFGMKTL